MKDFILEATKQKERIEKMLLEPGKLNIRAQALKDLRDFSREVFGEATDRAIFKYLDQKEGDQRECETIWPGNH